jgi:hypothetical protein
MGWNVGRKDSKCTAEAYFADRVSRAPRQVCAFISAIYDHYVHIGNL